MSRFTAGKDIFAEMQSLYSVEWDFLESEYGPKLDALLGEIENLFGNKTYFRLVKEKEKK